jgi:hypothetical protein
MFYLTLLFDTFSSVFRFLTFSMHLFQNILHVGEGSKKIVTVKHQDEKELLIVPLALLSIRPSVSRTATTVQTSLLTRIF